MARTTTPQHEAEWRSFSSDGEMWDAPVLGNYRIELLAELAAERFVSRALAEALEKTMFAAAAMVRAIDRHVPKDIFDKIMTDIGTQYDGFGVQAGEALALYRESKQ